MLPRGPLMIEHRLIEKAINTMSTALEHFKKDDQIDTAYVDMLIDFIRVYADKTHHGKEEDILFKELEEKNMTQEEQSLMEKLKQDHIKARQAVKAIDEANMKYKKGELNNTDVIYDNMLFLIQLYPQHIKDEDEVFFPDTEKYFDEEERAQMLDDFWEFDKRMIHEKYAAVYETLKTMA